MAVDRRPDQTGQGSGRLQQEPNYQNRPAKETDPRLYFAPCLTYRGGWGSVRFFSTNSWNSEHEFERAGLQRRLGATLAYSEPGIGCEFYDKAIQPLRFRREREPERYHSICGQRVSSCESKLRFPAY